MAADALLAANAANNARGDGRRHRRWRPAREAAWELLDGRVREGARVLVLGAGNGDTLPLRTLAGRAAALDLVDLDATALARARMRAGGAAHVRTLAGDATGGAAEAVVAGRPPLAVPDAPLGAGGYDVAVCDLMLSQLLYPALRRAGRASEDIDAVLLADGQRLTDGVIGRLHRSAPEGVVVVLHDLLGWWTGHGQPFTLQELLAAARRDVGAALRLAAGGRLPYGCDPWRATRRAGARVVETRLWRWPFAPGADYAVCGLVTRGRAGA